MLQSTSRHGISLTQDPGVRIVIDGRLHGGDPQLGGWVSDAWSSVKSFVGDVGEGFTNLPGVVYHSAKQIKDTAKLAIGEGCKLLVSDEVRSVAQHCGAALLVPPAVPGQAEVVAACAAYQAAVLACGMLWPQVPPLPQGASGSGVTSNGQQISQLQAQQLQAITTVLAQQQRSGLMKLQAGAEKPWYKRGSTYAAAGGVAAAIGAAYYFARVR